MNMFLSTWILLAAGLVFALPMIHLRVKEHTDIADETLYVAYVLKLFEATINIEPNRARMDTSGNIRPTERG